MTGSGESFPPNIQGSGDNSTCMPKILPDSFVVQRNVPVYGITQLGLWSHPTGSVTHEALTTTLLFVRSDKPVYTTMSIRPFSPCHPTETMAKPIVSHIRNPYPAFSDGVHNFHGCFYPRRRRPQGRFPDFRCLDPFRTQAPHQCFGCSRQTIPLL